MRRESQNYQTSIEDLSEDPVGRSYSMQPVDTSMNKIFEARARRFLLFAVLLQGGLVAAIMYRDAVLARIMPPDLEGPAAMWFPWVVFGLYGLFVVAYGLGKTGETMGAGFWRTFLMSLIPPLLPAVGARMGGRSVTWAYIYLAVDALLISLAWRYLDAFTVPLALMLVVLLPLLVYHLTGCAMGQIASNLGVNSYAAVTWLCMAPLAFVFYQASTLGLGEQFIEAMIEPGVRLSPESLKALADLTTLGTASYTATVFAVGWLVVGWLFWLKSVYESLRYPLF